MATTKKPVSTDAVEEEVVTPEAPVRMHCMQYFQNFRDDVHDYSKAAVRGQYRDILKTREEWDEVMKDFRL